LLDLPDADALPMAALALVERLVPCDTVSHNAIDLELGRAIIHTTGPLPDADTIRVFAHAAENPLVAYQDATGDPSPVRLSDFVTARQFRRRPIYNLVYRGLGMEFQLAFGVGADPGQVVGIALNRGHRDFSDRDIEVLALLRPLLGRIGATVGVDDARQGVARRARRLQFPRHGRSQSWGREPRGDGHGHRERARTRSPASMGWCRCLWRRHQAP
jgi:hypothetical protein